MADVFHISAYGGMFARSYFRRQYILLKVHVHIDSLVITLVGIGVFVLGLQRGGRQEY